MKIISKFKDYYDYLQGIYGIDEKIIYERKSDGTDPLYVPYYSIEKPDFNILHICGTKYCIHHFKSTFYFGDYVMIDDKFYHNGVIQSWMTFEKFEKQQKNINNNDEHLKSTNINEKHNCPIIIITPIKIINKNVKLMDFGINKIIPPHDIYIKISNFLSRETEVKINQTDKEKIVTHGFDLKTSFRH